MSYTKVKGTLQTAKQMSKLQNPTSTYDLKLLNGTLPAPGETNRELHAVNTARAEAGLPPISPESEIVNPTPPAPKASTVFDNRTTNQAQDPSTMEFTRATGNISLNRLFLAMRAGGGAMGMFGGEVGQAYVNQQNRLANAAAMSLGTVLDKTTGQATSVAFTQDAVNNQNWFGVSNSQMQSILNAAKPQPKVTTTPGLGNLAAASGYGGAAGKSRIQRF